MTGVGQSRAAGPGAASDRSTPDSRRSRRRPLRPPCAMNGQSLFSILVSAPHVRTDGCRWTWWPKA